MARGSGAEAAIPTARSPRTAEGLSREIDSGRDVYVYFNDDQGGHAPRDAQRLAGLIVRG